MSAEYCPRCKNWRTAHYVIKVAVATPLAGSGYGAQDTNRNECAACEIYWDSDRPEWLWSLRDGSPAR